MMLKPGLGKGLGELMQGEDVAGKNGVSEPKAQTRVTFGRGLQTLVSVAAQEPEAVPKPKPPLLPTWFYFAADILLLAYTIAIAFDASRPFDSGTIAFCAVAIAAGAVLAVLGVMQAAR